MAELIDDMATTMTQSANCEQHGEYVAQGYQFGSRVHWSRCPECEEAVKAKRDAEERDRIERQRRYRIEGLVQRCGLPKRFRSRTFDNYRPLQEGHSHALKIARQYAEHFEDRLAHGGGLIFCGRPGTGKTHLAAAIANRVISTGRLVVFITVMGSTRRVKETYQRDSQETERQAIRAFLEPELLILDEVGVQFGSETEKLILFEILNGRYEDMRPTLLISNFLLEELTAYIGERIVDRMTEGGGAVVSFDWESYRSRVHKDPRLPATEVKPVDWTEGGRLF